MGAVFKWAEGKLPSKNLLELSPSADSWLPEASATSRLRIE